MLQGLHAEYYVAGEVGFSKAKDWNISKSVGSPCVHLLIRDQMIQCMTLGAKKRLLQNLWQSIKAKAYNTYISQIIWNLHTYDMTACNYATRR